MGNTGYSYNMVNSAGIDSGEVLTSFLGHVISTGAELKIMMSPVQKVVIMITLPNYCISGPQDTRCNMMIGWMEQTDGPQIYT